MEDKCYKIYVWERHRPKYVGGHKLITHEITETSEHVSQDRRSSGRDLNLVGVLTTLTLHFRHLNG
jgi:hypothetical protein